MRITCGLIGLLYGVVAGILLGPLLFAADSDGPLWLDRIVKTFAAVATLGAWGLIVGSLAVLSKRHWGTRFQLLFSAVLLIAIYTGTAIPFGQYVNGHMSVLMITPFLLGLMIVLRWSWLQRARADFNSPPPDAKHPRWQFTIRTLLVAMLIVALWLSWRAVNVRQAERERQVAEKLGDAADSVGGVGGSITYVTLNASAGDEHLKLLAQLPTLRFLSIERSRISDDGLAQLKDLKYLISVDITDVRISGEGLKYLAPRSIQTLLLMEWQDVGPGLAHINELPNRVHVMLHLSGTDIGDEDAIHLKSLKRLTSLNLAQTQISDAGAQHLTQLDSLRQLNLEGTRITQKGLEQLTAALPNTRIVANPTD